MILSLAIVFSAQASSHREAPAISLDPSADITDFYMFKSPADATKLVFIMNVNPAEEPGGGPNFYRFDDDVLYEIHVDNEGDAEADITWQIRFDTVYQQPETFLYNTGPINVGKNLNMVQSYSVTQVKDGVSSTALTKATVAPINVGVASVDPDDYHPTSKSAGSLTTSHITTSGSNRFFAGPRQDGFYVDLEHTFDLLNLFSGVPNNNSLLGKNVHSIAIEVPITAVTMDGAAASTTAKNNVIASWATTSRRAVTVRRTDGVTTGARGNWVQVSRLGNPLVNEVVIPIAQKDVFSAAHPRDDGQFLASVNHSLLGDYMNAILGTDCPLTVEQGLPDSAGFDGRDDLVLAFLTGYPGINQWPGFALGGDIPAEASGKTYAAYEALRIDLTSATGWPNGRNVGDDVVDTALSAVCGLLDDGTMVADGVDSTGLYYLSTFPFLGDPWSGNDHPHGGHDR